ncbi:unnamed protein product, partial [Meganyctiphanes norvegica]
VCGGNPPSAGCVAYIDNRAGACDCDTINNLGFHVDPYDSSQFFLCIPAGGQYFLSCPEGEIFSTEVNECIPSPSTNDGSDPLICSTEGIGFHTTDSTCKTFTACVHETPDLPGVVLSCDVDEAFDSSLSQPRCVPQCDLAPTQFTCPTNSMGVFPDTSDCKIFHVCSNGIEFSTSIPCPDGQLFNGMTCVPSSSNVVCPEINECWPAYCEACPGTCPETSSYTTADPVAPNCNNSPGYYEDPTDCKK